MGNQVIVDLMSQYFVSMSFTPESSETTYPINYGQSSYGSSYKYDSYSGYPPLPQPPQYTKDYIGSQGQLISVRAHPDFPLYSTYVGLDQYNYDSHVQTYLSSYRNSMTWYEYCLLQNEQPHTFQFQLPRHSSFY